MHPTIWEAAARLWDDGHIRQAVQTVVAAARSARDGPVPGPEGGAEQGLPAQPGSVGAARQQPGIEHDVTDAAAGAQRPFRSYRIQRAQRSAIDQVAAVTAFDLGVVLTGQGHSEEAVTAYDLVLGRYGDDPARRCARLPSARVKHWQRYRAILSDPAEPGSSTARSRAQNEYRTGRYA